MATVLINHSIYFCVQAEGFKKDFEEERKDRERAHSKIAHLESKSLSIPDEIARSLQAEVYKITKERDKYKESIADLNEKYDILVVQNRHCEEKTARLQGYYDQVCDANDRNKQDLKYSNQDLEYSNQELEYSNQEVRKLRHQLKQYQRDPASNYTQKVDKMAG